MLLVFAGGGNGRRRARSINPSRIHRVGVSCWQCCTGSVVQVGVAGLRLGVLVFGNVRVSGNFVGFGVVVAGHVECGLFLGIGKRLLNVVVDLFVQLLGVGIDFFPIGVVGVGDVQHGLAGFKLGRDVIHLDSAGGQLLRQEQVSVIQIHILTFFYQVETLGL